MKKKKSKSVSFPEMPKLKKLGLHFWRLHNFEVFSNKPFLREVELILNESPALVDPFTTLPIVSPSVKYLRCRDTYMDVLNEDGIEVLAELFPNLEELDVKLEDDDTLRSIFRHMTKLKRLDLNNSQITDSGITGISERKLKTAFETWLPLDEVAKLRDGPHIGDLKGTVVPGTERCKGNDSQGLLNILYL
jgi:hypothetical protein